MVKKPRVPGKAQPGSGQDPKEIKNRSYSSLSPAEWEGSADNCIVVVFIWNTDKKGLRSSWSRV